MEKIKVFVLKSPTFLSIFTFITAVALVYILKYLLAVKNMGLEQTLAPIAITYAYFYGKEFKEQMSRVFRLKYSLITTLPYLLLSILFAYFSPQVSQLKIFNMLCIGIMIQFLLIVLGIYFLSGYMSKIASRYDYQRIQNEQKNIPIEIRQKKNQKAYLLILILAIPTTLLILDSHHIIHLNTSESLSLAVISPILLFLLIYYLKKLYGVKPTLPDKNQSSDNLPSK